MSEKKTAKAKLGIEYVPTDKLIPYARNAKTHSPEQVAAIAGSIREFGFNNPVLIDPENGIIAGHGRVLAAQKLELAEIPCIRLGHLTEAQKRAYILADNKLAEYGAGWDNRMLALELDQLLADGFKPLDLGFDAGDMGKLSKDFLDLENPLGWNEDMIPVQAEKRTQYSSTNMETNPYCALREAVATDLVSGPCPHACTYCFVRTSKAGLGQKGFKETSKQAIEKAVLDAAAHSKCVSFGMCMDAAIPQTMDLLKYALGVAKGVDVFVELHTKNPGNAIAAFVDTKFPVERGSIKPSFSFLDDKRSKIAEPGAPVASVRMADMKRAFEMGLNVVFRHDPIILGYIPDNLGEIVAATGAKLFNIEPLRLAATTIAHNMNLGKAMDLHDFDLNKWCEEYFVRDANGKFALFGAFHYYQYRKDRLHAELEKAFKSVTDAGVHFGVCSGFYGVALEPFNAKGIPYSCWMPQHDKMGLAVDHNSLCARLCQGRMNELREPFKGMSEEQVLLELDRIQAVNVPEYTIEPDEEVN